jgi:hypothetical protein
MKYCEKPVKDYLGAKHWANILNMKLKIKYGKSEKCG